MARKTIRIGIFGMKRGTSQVKAILLNDGEIVAICDKNPATLSAYKEKYDRKVACFDNFDDFINHPMDAVYLANYFPEHAPYAIKALEKGIHVLSECTSNGTMAEGVMLVEAAEKSKAIYMLAENYPYMLFNQEMRKVYDNGNGSLGRALYAEGEYNHTGLNRNVKDVSYLYDSENHWRAFLPKTYYLTHSLGPLMMVTKSNPVRVCALPVLNPTQPTPDDITISASWSNEHAAVMTTFNDDGSVFRFFGNSHFGFSENSYRIACQKGQIENVRGTDGKVMLTYNPWDVPEGKETVNFYTPKPDKEDAPGVANTGHSGSDYYMFKDFFNCIRNKKQPYFDVYVATKMASVAIMAHRSMLELGVPKDIPDFRNKEDRQKYADDWETPFYSYDGELKPTVRVSYDKDFEPYPDRLERFRKIFKKTDE